ncbi:MAG: DUF4160 domain-containing protein [Chitinophagales bacterium]|nr:DUF4160 domain-containing protein [Chitinophagales bacterium]
MPEIFRQSGFIFKFYSDDHEPIHVHIVKAGKEVIFEVSETGIRLRNNYGMKNSDVKTIATLVQENKALIIKTWTDFFIYKK